MALDSGTTAPALFLAILFIDISLSIQTQIQLSHLTLGPFQRMMFVSLRMSLVLHGKWLAEC